MGKKGINYQWVVALVARKSGNGGNTEIYKWANRWIKNWRGAEENFEPLGFKPESETLVSR